MKKYRMKKNTVLSSCEAINCNIELRLALFSAKTKHRREDTLELKFK